jgi:hypothetical protein
LSVDSGDTPVKKDLVLGKYNPKPKAVCLRGGSWPFSISIRSRSHAVTPQQNHLRALSIAVMLPGSTKLTSTGRTNDNNDQNAK